MDDERSKRIQDDMAKLERAAEEHDWAEEIIDDAVGGLVSPLTQRIRLKRFPTWMSRRRRPPNRKIRNENSARPKSAERSLVIADELP